MLSLEMGECYNHYKRDTEIAITYIANSATARGYIAPRPNTMPTGRMKGSKRAAASMSGNAIKLTTAEIIRQATFVAELTKPRIKVPIDVQVALKRAITRRKKCSSWFTDADQEEHQVDNAKHDHFISVLEQVKDTLKPNFEAPTRDTPSTAREEKASDTLENRFEGLQIYDTGAEDDFDITAEDIVSAPRGNSKYKAKAYELEEKAEEDLPFLVWCFYQDLHNMQHFLQATWNRYSKGLLDLSTASVITQVALELVNQAERKLVEVSPAEFKPDDIYDTPECAISKHLLKNTHSHDPHAKMVLWTYRLEAIMLFLLRTTLDSTVHGAPWVMPVTSLLEESRTSQFMLSFEHDYRLLAKAFLDIRYLSKNRAPEFSAEYFQKSKVFANNFPTDYRSFPDIFTETLKVSAVKSHTVAAVFAVRVFLDIQNTLGERVEESYERLRTEGADAVMKIGLNWPKRKECPQSLPELKTTWGSREAAAQSYRASVYIRLSIQMNLIGICKAFSMNQPNHLWHVPCLCDEDSRIDDEKMIMPDRSPVYYYSHNPTYCGVESLRLCLAMENLGVLSTNAWLSFATTAHLYNLAKQTQRLKFHWSALEVAMELNKKELFSGSFPTQPPDFVRRFLICFGFSAVSFAKNARTPLHLKLQNPGRFSVPKDIIKRCSLSSPLESYFERKVSAEKLLCEVNRESRKGRSMPKRGLTKIQMLEGLEEALEEALPRLRIDYTTLMKQSNELMTKIQHAFGGSLMAINHDSMRDNMFPTIVYAILEDANSTLMSQKKKHDTTLFGGNILEAAVQIMEPFIEQLEIEYTKIAEPFSIEMVTRNW